MTSRYCKLLHFFFIFIIGINSNVEPESELIFYFIIQLCIYCAVNFQLVWRYGFCFKISAVVLRKREISNSSRTEATRQIIKILSDTDMEIVNQENQL